MFLKYKLKFLSLLPPLSLSGGVESSASFSIASSFAAPQFIHVYVLIPVDEVVGDSVITPVFHICSVFGITLPYESRALQSLQ